MQPTDDIGFAKLIARIWGFYGKTPTGDEVAAWFELLAEFPLDVVAKAFNRHLVDPNAGRFMPKPADLVRFLPVPRPEDDGRPGSDEAWGMLLRLARDEAETGALSEEMRQGWEACGPILAEGDEVGARRCFLQVYDRAVQAARASHEPPRWTVTLGTDRALRDTRLREAVDAKRLSRDQAIGLLSGPAPASLEQVAGLLEGPDRPPQGPTALRRNLPRPAPARAGRKAPSRPRPCWQRS